MRGFVPQSPDAPAPASKITQEANRAFKKSRATGGYWVLLFGVGVGTMVTTATYIFFQWRQHEIDQRRGWLEFKELVMGTRKGGATSDDDADAGEAEVVVAVKEKGSSSSSSANTRRDEVVLILPDADDDHDESVAATAGKPEKAMVPGVGRIGGKLRMLNVPLDVFPSSVEEFMSFPYPVYSIFIWTTAATLTTLFAWSRGKWMWYRRHFMGRVNFSLNTVHNGTLKFRTLFERSLYDMMFRNQAAVKIVGAAANRTVVGRPFLEIPPAENWYVLNNVLNEISSLCSIGFVQADAGMPVRWRTYIFGLTCEKEKAVWNRKLRVMLVDEELLKRVLDMPTPRFEEAHHGVRWSTLQAMARLYRKQVEEQEAAERAGTPLVPGGYLGRVELAIPYGSSTGGGGAAANSAFATSETELREEEEDSRR